MAKRILPRVGGELPPDYKPPRQKPGPKPKPPKKKEKAGAKGGPPSKHKVKRSKGGDAAKKESARNAALVVRRHEALKLKIAGATYLQIGERLGVSPTTAYFDVHEALGEHDEDMKKLAPRYRDLALAELNAVQLNHWTPMQNGDRSAAMIVLRCIDAKLRVTGGYAPLKVAATDLEGRPFKDVSREEILRRLEDYARSED